MPIVWYKGDSKNDYPQLAAYTQNMDGDDWATFGTWYGTGFTDQEKWKKMNSANNIVGCPRGTGRFWDGLDSKSVGKMELIKQSSQNAQTQKKDTGAQHTVKELTHVVVANAIHHDSQGHHLSV